MSPVAAHSVKGMLSGAELSGSTAVLDAEVLLAHVLRKDRSWLIAHPDSTVSRDQAADYTARVRRRADGCPVAYLIGRQEFFGREFLVTPDVLVPRPESETLVTEALKLIKSGDTVIDLGTGSGCLAVTIDLETTNVHVMATDTSPAALRIAATNARRLGSTIQVSLTDLLPETVPDPKRCVVVANLPYVSDGDYQANPDLRHEPALALQGGKDGLDVVRRLFEQLQSRNFRPRELMLEVDPAQISAIRRLVDGDVTVHKDLAGRDRIIRIN